ncbi:MAG TPA: S8 family serine peptidase, partial [Pyrinomonadaceae bacterium]
LGTSAVDSYRNDPLCRAARKLVDAGLVVVAAAGNEGKDAAGQKTYGRIHSPGIEPSVITVGASNSFGTDARADDAVTTYSSRGPTRGFWTDLLGVRRHDNLVKPDLVAPGNKIVDAAAVDNYLLMTNPGLDAGVSPVDARRMMYLNGTSMATPAVAGAAALMLQANPTLTPNLVKTLLMYTAQQLPGANLLEQGAGELNVEGAVRLAKLVRRDLSALTPLGAPLLTSAAAPAPQTTIAGETFVWSQGIVIKYGYATGTDLVTAYQKIYGLGVIATDAILFSDGVIATDRSFLTAGVIATDNILVSSGRVLGDGTIFLGAGVIATDRFVGAGVIATDRTGAAFGDGVIATDGVLDADAAVQALSAATNGDATKAPPPAPETGLDCLDCR